MLVKANNEVINGIMNTAHLSISGEVDEYEITIPVIEAPTTRPINNPNTPASL